jgi:hypothetical protein
VTLVKPLHTDILQTLAVTTSSGHEGCIPFHHQQYGHAGCTPFHQQQYEQSVPQSAVRIFPLHYQHHRPAGCIFSTAFSVDIQGVSLSTNSSVVMQGISLCVPNLNAFGYQTEMSDARMPVLAASSLTPIPSYEYLT